MVAIEILHFLHSLSYGTQRSLWLLAIFDFPYPKWMVLYQSPIHNNSHQDCSIGVGINLTKEQKNTENLALINEICFNWSINNFHKSISSRVLSSYHSKTWLILELLIYLFVPCDITHEWIMLLKHVYSFLSIFLNESIAIDPKKILNKEHLKLDIRLRIDWSTLSYRMTIPLSFLITMLMNNLIA